MAEGNGTPLSSRKNPNSTANSLQDELQMENTDATNGCEFDDTGATSSSCNTPLLQRKRGRFSYYSQNSEKSSKTKRKGFLSIFKWFRKRPKSKDSFENSSTVTNESINSLNNSLNDEYYVPLSRSKSAENHKVLVTDLKKSESMRSASVAAGKISSGIADDEYENVNNDRIYSRFPQKKRSAPPPPLQRSGDSSTVAMRETSFNRNSSNRYSPLDPSNPFYSSKRNSMESNYSTGGISSRMDNDNGIYSRTKRRAPQPPATNWTAKVQQVTENHEGSLKANNQSTLTSINRPVSEVSASDANDPSQFSTLRSNSSRGSSTLKGSISSKCSGESFRLEKGYLKQDLVSSSPAVPEIGSTSPNPKPWYKRKKKVKQGKTQEKLEPIDQVYEFWRPEIQFNDGKISLSQITPEQITQKTQNKSIREKVVEACKPKRKSQISLLASISQLDQEATEHLQREKLEKKAAKEALDDKFYKNSTLLNLTQGDVSGNSPCSSSSMLPSNRKEDSGNLYDNIETSNAMKNNSLGYTNSTTLKMYGERPEIPEKSKKKESRETSQKPSAPEIESLKPDNLSSWPIKSYSTDIKSKENKNINNAEASSSKKQTTSLLQMANMDAEMFYQLAKDAKKSPSGIGIKSNVDKGSIGRRNSSSSQDSDSDRESHSPKFQRHKNFGLRMNQLFTPDVSVILEGSESIASTATTPADEAMSDIHSTMATSDLIYQDFSIQSDAHLEFLTGTQSNKKVAREIMRELNEVQNEIDRINGEEAQSELQRECDKADRIRNEIISLRERDNFSVWQDLVSSISSQDNQRNNSPSIEINSQKPESKLKWICNVCTLINLPWRITCEACSSRRPNEPTRVKEDGSRISPDKTREETKASTEERTEAPVESIPSFPPQPQCAQSRDPVTSTRGSKTNWENELRKYFIPNMDQSSSTDEHSSNTAGTSHILFNQVGQETTNQTISKSTEHTFQGGNIESNREAEPSLDEIRKARIERFEQGIRTFEAILKGNSESNSPNLTRRDRTENIGRSLVNQVNALLPQFENGEKSFYKKQVRKTPVLNTQGAVKSTISIFNQKDQLDQAKDQSKPQKHTTRRKSIGLIKEQANIFEKMSSERNELSNRSKSVTKELPRPFSPEKAPEIDITYAISKFDELAAKAEVERLNPKITKANFNRKPKRIIISTPNEPSMLKQNVIQQRNSSVRIPNSLEVEAKTNEPVVLNLQDIQSSEPLVNGSSEGELERPESSVYVSGVLYAAPESGKCRSSISSGTFELIHPREFEEFEAERSQMGSPPPTSIYEDTFQQDSDQDIENEDTFEDASIDQVSNFLGESQEISVSDRRNYEEYFNDVSIKTKEDNAPENDSGDNNHEAKKNQVDELSEQLTLSRGIANFKGKARM